MIYVHSFILNNITYKIHSIIINNYNIETMFDFIGVFRTTVYRCSKKLPLEIQKITKTPGVIHPKLVVHRYTWDF